MATVITYGTFDLFHIGHLRLQERAKGCDEKASGMGCLAGQFVSGCVCVALLMMAFTAPTLAVVGLQHSQTGYDDPAVFFDWYNLIGRIPIFKWRLPFGH